VLPDGDDDGLPDLIDDDCGAGACPRDGGADQPRAPAPDAAAPDSTAPVEAGAPSEGPRGERPADAPSDTPRPAPAALFVVGTTNLGAGDAFLKSRLDAKRIQVLTIAAAQATAADAAGKALVVISESAGEPAVTTKFRDVAVPVVCLEPMVYDDMAMTGAVANVDHGFVGAQTRITLTASTHPLAAGLTGTVAVLSQPHSIGFGVPGAAAVRIATIVGQATQATIFGYAPGATMVGRTAPARRVGWFALQIASVSLTAEGVRLFDAAIDWALAN
jgi:hypothetical protein